MNFFKKIIQKAISSIRNRIIIYFSFLFIIIVIFIFIFYLYGLPLAGIKGVRYYYKIDALRSMSLIADQKKIQFSAWLRDCENEIWFFSKNYIDDEFLENYQECSKNNFSIESLRIFDKFTIKTSNFKKIFDRYIDIFITDTSTGKILVSFKENNIGKDHSNEEYFKHIFGNDQQYHITYNKHIDHLDLLLSYRYVSTKNDDFNKEPLSFIVNFQIDMRKIFKNILHEGDALGRSGEVLLVSKDRNILHPLKHKLQNESAADIMTYRISAQPAFFAARGEEGIIDSVDYRGKKVLAAYRHIRFFHDHGWGMVVKIDQSEIYAPFRQNILNLVILSFLGLIIIIIAAFYISFTLTRSVKALVRASEKILNDDLSARVDIFSNDEINILITTFNQMADRIENWHKELGKQIKNRTLNLQNANQELEQFIYIASHDLRTPLVNIDGYSRELDNVLQEMKDLLNSKLSLNKIKSKFNTLYREEIKDSLYYIRISTQKMDMLLSGLLSISRTSRISFNYENVKMKKVAQEVFAGMHFLLKKIKARVVLKAVPDCYADTQYVNQVLTNVISNAIKYSDPKRKLEIIISGRIKKDTSEYCIADNGIGIDKNQQNKIFEIFYQSDPKKSSGDGLGLSFCRKILRRMNGDIKVKSVLNKGSKFYIILPRKT